MSKETLEHLSSLMDGEISREAGSFLTRRLFSDDAMCEKWERYHLIRDCIRQPGGKQLVTGLSLKLSASLDAEAAANRFCVASSALVKTGIRSGHCRQCCIDGDRGYCAAAGTCPR